MDISVRSMLTAGISAVGACALVLAPSVVPPAHDAPTTVMHIPATTLAASVAPLTQKLLQPVVDALDEAVTGDTMTTAAVAPANAASNLIDSVYSVSKYWANYVSLDLAPWALQFIPFGWLATDQINIWYYPFVLRTTDAFVYKFLDPIVNNPLNLNVWINSTVTLINETVSGFINGVIGEINYLFGWILPPLPPLPGSPTAVSLAADTAEVGAVPATARFALATADETTPAEAGAQPAGDADTPPAAVTPDVAPEVTPEVTPVDETVATTDAAVESTDDTAEAAQAADTEEEAAEAAPADATEEAAAEEDAAEEDAAEEADDHDADAAAAAAQAEAEAAAAADAKGPAENGTDNNTTGKNSTGKNSTDDDNTGTNNTGTEGAGAGETDGAAGANNDAGSGD